MKSKESRAEKGITVWKRLEGFWLVQGIRRGEAGWALMRWGKKTAWGVAGWNRGTVEPWNRGIGESTGKSRKNTGRLRGEKQKWKLRLDKLRFRYRTESFRQITQTVTALELRTFLPRMLVPERLCSLRWWGAAAADQLRQANRFPCTSLRIFNSSLDFSHCFSMRLS